MGLLDSFSLDELEKPQNQALLAMGLSMLAPKQAKTSVLGDIGQGGLLGLQTLTAANQQERSNRQSDLQQLTGAYNMLKQQEFGKMLAAKQAGTPYSPNPMLPQMEARLAQLTGLNNLSGKYGLTPPSPQATAPAAPPAPAMPPPGMAPPSQSVMANPDYQPPQVRPQTPQTPQAPQRDSSGLGGPAGGVPMEAWLAMDPTGAKYMEQLAKDNQPVVLRQGDLVGKNPDGTYKSLYQQPQSVPGVLPNRNPQGQVESFREGPGFAQAASNIKSAETGAVASAEDPHTMVTVTLADGRTVPVPRSALVGKPAPGGLPMVTPQGTQSQTPTAKLTVTQPSQQSDDPWATIPLRKIPQGMGQSSYDAALTKLQADTASKLAEKYGAVADTAQQRVALNSQAKELVDRADTGLGATMIGDVKNLLVSRFGIPQSDFANDPAATAALNKDLMNAAVAKAKASFGARMSTNEVNNMLKRGAPNGDMLASAIKFLLDADTATARYQIQQGNNLGAYLGKGGDPLQFEAWHAKAFPLSKTLDQVRLPPNTRENDNGNYGWSAKRVN